jgi:hypothetical protein
VSYRDDPWMALCSGRACIACGRNDETVVAAHSNQQAHGKGKGIKAESWTCLPLCRACHYAFDHDMERNKVGEFWARHWAFHMVALCSAGLVIPLGHKERERRPVRLAKSLPRVKPDWNGPEAA